MPRSPFAIFRKHQKVLMVVLTMLAMFAFVVLDALQTANEIPISLWALIGAGIGAGIFWLLGSSGGKGTEWALAGAVLGGVIVLVLPRFFGDRGVVSTSVGNLSEEELHDLMRRRRTANFVIRDAFAAGNPFPERLADISPELADMAESSFAQQFLGMYQRQWSQQLNQYQFGGLSEASTVTTWLLAHEADDMGIAISDEAVTAYLQAVAAGKLRGQDLTRIRKEHGLSESQLYDILRYELKARQVALLSEPRLLATPEDLWDLYRRFNVRQELALTAVPVERFVEADKEPSRTELLEFFEKYKNQFPTGDEPGFYQPREVQLAYLEADFESIRSRLFPDPITDEQLQAYYNEHRDEFRNPAFQTEQNGTSGTPAAGPALTAPGGDAPADRPAVDGPAAGTPDEGAPTADAPQGAAQPEGSGTTPATPDAPAAPDGSAAPAPGAEAAAPGDGQADVPRENELFPVAFVAQDEPASPGEQPASESPPASDPAQPADSPPAAATPEAGAAQPATTEEPANQPAADDQPAAADQATAADGQPAAGQPGPAARPRPLPPSMPEDPVSEYLSFEEVRERIRSRLEQERDEQVRKEIDSLMDTVGDRMYELARAHKAPPGDADRLTAEQVSKQLQELAAEHNLRYVVTDHLSYEQLQRETIGQMTDANAAPFDGSPPLADQVFQSGPDANYIRMRFRDLTGDEIIAWKIDDEADHVPEFNDEGIEERVLEAWRLAQARPRAEERAKELAELVRKHPEKDMQQALAGTTLTGEPGGLEPTVRNTRSFTWLRQSSAPNPSQLGPSTDIEQSTVDGVEEPGPEFMETVFNDLEEGEIGVAPNADKSIYYVVKVVNRSTSSEAGRNVLLADLLRAPLFEDQAPYPRLLGSLQQQLGQAWYQRLTEKYNVQQNRPLDEQSRAEF